jgi:hypothetical protein
MSNIIDKIVLDDTREPYCDDDNQSTNIEFGLLSVALSPPEDCSLREEERSYQISDSSSQQQNASTSSDELEYRIHLGTQPGDDTKGQITFIQSQGFHSRIINYVEAFLITSKVNIN